MMIRLLSMEYRPLIAILIPAFVSILVLFSGRRPNIREAWTLSGSLLLFFIVLSLNYHVVENGPIRIDLFDLLEGVRFGFRIDGVGLVFATTSSSLWILVSLYSIGYMRSLHEHAQTRYYACFAVAIAGAVGIAFSGNLVTFFLFYELLTLSTYPLVAHEESPEAISAGHKYLAYLLGGGLFFLLGILLTYGLTRTTDFNPAGIFKLVPVAVHHKIFPIIFFCFLLGFVKAAWIPFHSWLPSAMVAPTPVSALLHAVAVVKAGVFGMIRIVCYIFGIDAVQMLGIGWILAGIAAFTVITANLYAIGQINLKRMLAYSTINQLSFILLGTAVLTPMAITGSILHIAFHGYMKITLFLCAGAITVIAGKKEIREIQGVGRVMPLTMSAFVIGALGMCGAPPAAGFISKWHIALGSIQSGYWIFLMIIFMGSLLDVVYFFPVIRTAFFEKIPVDEIPFKDVEKKVPLVIQPETRVETQKPIYLFMIIPILLTAIFSIVLCLFPNLFLIYELTQTAVDEIFGG
ncbi:MAG: monovalent cation/H+ antiporter subunit D family protein [Thermodesulfobacteriota bacterium]